MRVLIVDDSSNFRNLLKADLEEVGASVVDAPNGRRALAIAQRDSAFDLVITDVNMPEMDGLDFTAGLRALPGFARTPVLVLTAERAPDAKERARKIGVTAWVVKPYAKDALLAAVRRIHSLAA